MSRLPHWENFLGQSVDTKKIPKEKQGRVGYRGKKTKLPINRWLELAFEWNEFRSIERFLRPEVKPLYDEQILKNFILEFSSKNKVKWGGGVTTPGNSILSGKHTINFQRNKYRKGILYPTQQKPMLLSFKYFQDGNITADRTRVKPNYLDFKQCQQLCIDYKVADPRFFSLEDLERIHQMTMNTGTFSEWTFPTKEDLAQIHSVLPIPLYRSVMTYDLHKKINPHQKSSANPLSKINEEIEKAEEEQLIELEKRRRETKAFIENFQED